MKQLLVHLLDVSSAYSEMLHLTSDVNEDNDCPSHTETPPMCDCQGEMNCAVNSSSSSGMLHRTPSVNPDNDCPLYRETLIMCTV